MTNLSSRQHDPSANPAKTARREGNLRDPARSRLQLKKSTSYNNAQEGPTMITFRITTDDADDRRVVLTLPPEVPTGQPELVVTVDSPAPDKKLLRTSLADWLEVQAKRNGSDQARYPLRGSVVRYDQPTDPVTEADWEAMR